ncbi:MAG: hypothetical protein FJW23_07005 [Acidimicrobiia bacterium]|nr:hypothetical protein [Acidimicrobiia bacterium]
MAGLALVCTPFAAYAHHAFAAEFDADKPVKLRGVIKKMDWINPHTWMYIEVKEPDGTVTEWAIEGGAPNAMFRRGWNMNSIKPGIEVVVDGYRAKSGENKANGRDVTLPDGKQLFMGSSGTGAPNDPTKK